MFTGIVEELGTVLSAPGPEGRLVVEAGTVGTDSGPGASMAVNGVCLTVVERDGPDPTGRWTLGFDVSEETSESAKQPTHVILAGELPRGRRSQ